MEWFDSRLIMQNLKEDIQLNVLADEERQDPWFPVVVFRNNKESERFVLDKKASLVVRKEGEGIENTSLIYLMKKERNEENDRHERNLKRK